MDDSVLCPGCQANLMLPSAGAGQTVQCVRCKHSFELGKRSINMVTESSPISSQFDSDIEEPESLELRGPVSTPGPLLGEGIAAVSRLLFAGIALGCLFLMYTFFDVPLRERIFRDDRDELTRWIFGTGFLTVLLALPTFLRWSYLAAANARSMQTTGIMPSYVLLLGFLCPGVNLFVAYMNLQELWRTSDPEEVEDPDFWQQVQPSWWIRACGLNLVSASVLLFLALDLRQDHWITASLFIANLNVLVASILFIIIIQRIMQRQKARFIRLYEHSA